MPRKFETTSLSQAAGIPKNYKLFRLREIRYPDTTIFGAGSKMLSGFPRNPEQNFPEMKTLGKFPFAYFLPQSILQFFREIKKLYFLGIIFNFILNFNLRVIL